MAEYIDKQELVKSIVNTPLSWDFPVTPEHLTGSAKRQNEILTLIDDMPAADVRENVKGEWVFEKGDMVTCCDGWYCSHCKRGFHTNVPYFKDFNFCPMCGAAMEGDACNGDSCEI